MTTLTSPSTEQLKEQVDLLLHSSAFATSETLRKLLAFLAAHAIEGRPDTLKVREIAVGVFGRAEDFDSQTDSVVRVHTGRLRSKLAEYYMEDGADDDVIITIPKGGYALTCHFRHANGHSRTLEPLGLAEVVDNTAAPTISQPVIEAPVRYVPNWQISHRFWLLSLVLAALVSWGVTTYVHQRMERPKVPPVLSTFWQDFAAPADKALLVFSNFRLINGGAGAGLLTYDGPEDPQKPIIDTYTTMGEVMGVSDITRTLMSLGKRPEVKRSRLLTWDEAKDANVVFIGGPLAETPLRDIPLLKDLQFKPGTLRGDRKVGAIYNNNPRPHEERVYFASDSVYANSNIHTSKIDYAVVALRPSFNFNHRTLVLAGISEYGTQGATDFVTNERTVSGLLAALGVQAGQPMPAFEALVRVRVEGGVPVQSDLVLVHAQK